MGTASSVAVQQGVSANPRVLYSLAQQKKENLESAPAIDTPVLVDLGHGTVRYRYVQQDTDAAAPARRIELPHAGEEHQGKKGGYFYHARLKSYKPAAVQDAESDYKFKYVVQGPARQQCKQLYYVYGRGLGTREDSKLPPRAHPARPPQRDKVWTQGFRHPDEEYFLVQLLSQATDSSSLQSDDEQDLTHENPDPSLPFSVPLSGDQTVAELRASLSLRTLKAPDRVHLGLIGAQSELPPEASLWQSLRPEEPTPSHFKVQVTRVGTK